MRRVVVTGMGAVTPLGDSLEKTWKGLIEGKSGITKITRFDASDFPCQVGGQITETEEDSPTGFNYTKYMSGKDQRKMDLFIRYGIGAAVQAVEDSGWMPEKQEDLEMTGVSLGSGIGGLASIEHSSILCHEQGVRKVSPFFIPASLINLLSGHVSMRYGFQGPNHAVVTACATGAHSIGDAARMIRDGDANVMVAGGAEAGICKIGVAGFAAARALSTGYNDNPTQASRPWDKDRDGFVIGEGAGVVVLEEYEHAKKRGAKIYGELVGYGLTGDAYHVTSPHPEGRGGFRAMQMALKKSGLAIEDIGYVNAHATSTLMGDEIELKSIHRFFGDSAKKLSMSSTKSAIGHLLGAAGSTEAIISIMAMKTGILPPTLNLENPPEDCLIDLVPKVAKEKASNVVMTNSFGFGGTNATLIFKKI